MIQLINPKAAVLAGCLFVGLGTLLIGSYLMVTEIVFVHYATNFDPIVIEVRKQSVQKGKGSVIAYVPVVEVTEATHGVVKVPVDTFSEEPIYKIGDKMSVLCEISSRRCVPDTFLDKWGESAGVFLLSVVFLVMPLRYIMKVRRLRN